MYPHSAQLTRTIIDDRLAISERRRLILAAFADDKGDRSGLIARIAGIRPLARRARTSPAQ
jgi:hypothetical protein